MNPKISDFGMPWIFGGDKTEGKPTEWLGHMAMPHQNTPLNNLLLEAVWESYQAGKSSELIDSCLVDTSNLSQVLRCVHSSLLCLQEHPEDGPSMSSVVTMLSSDNALAMPRQPGFLVERNPQRKFLVWRRTRL
ncbi:hypothetical protein EUGRSUZ_F00833 [Eucalyptus grandis]|uniref:Serine-threonine/tyrosine-protein kinase catalytic domain-containing protein n=2 Tax=Eucalyptus grandis TaxID=71139 RepID=A0A059BMY3_EUCGR|nr:hypothetical protein EUGRSUZ_F00833 [Eucalyptus grandis]